MTDVLRIKFYLSKMRTAYQEKALHIALRNCSEEIGGKAIYVILVKGEYMQSSIFFSRRFLLVMRSSHHHEGF